MNIFVRFVVKKFFKIVFQNEIFNWVSFRSRVPNKRPKIFYENFVKFTLEARVILIIIYNLCKIQCPLTETGLTEVFPVEIEKHQDHTKLQSTFPGKFNNQKKLLN